VALLAHTQTALEDVARNICAAGGAALVYPVDLTDAQAVNEVARRVMARLTIRLALDNHPVYECW
jgi:short-subunit dehydrogenase